MLRPLFVCLALLAAACAAGETALQPLASAEPVPAAPPAAAGVPGLARAVPVDEALRAEYGRCDREDAFRELRFPIRDGRGRIRWHPCQRDPNRLETLVRLPAAGDAPEAVVFASKLGLDLDGSWIACNKAGVTDQCATSLMLPSTPSRPCVLPREPAGRCVPVDSDRVPYVVLPAAGPPGARASEFRDRTGIGVGDVGVVLFNGRTVPVIVADSGPFYKVGEGSMALHRALGIEFCQARDAAGHCTQARPGSSIPGGVVTILFPGSRPAGLTPDTIGDAVRQRAAALHAGLLRANPP